jgi:hypothetical protein
MHVIWRRPDGFHNARPCDYVLQLVAKNSYLWLHKVDKDYYPFRVSGGWQDESATKELNRLVNLLSEHYDSWLKWFELSFCESSYNSFDDYINNHNKWLDELLCNLRGDKWEAQIMKDTINDIKKKISENKDALRKDIVATI